MREFTLAELSAHAGQEIGVSDWLEVTQARIDGFAEATGDRQWIHVDVERATRERGGTIAHGYLVLSLIPQLAAQIRRLTGIAHSVNYGSDKVRFLKPVPAGARIRLRLSLIDATPKGDAMQFRYGMTVEIEGSDKPACVAETLTVSYPA